MTTTAISPILERLESEYRIDSSRLTELEKELADASDCGRNFGRMNSTTEEWNTHWQKHWNEIDSVLRRMGSLTREMDGSMSNGRTDHVKKALKAWEALLSEDANLVEALSVIRMHASELSATVRKDWNILAAKFDSILESIHACAQSLRIKLELLKKYSTEEVNQLFLNLLDTPVNRTGSDTSGGESYEQDYREASDELKRERHTNMGSMDVVKALWMWVETPDERVAKNRSLKIDEN